MTDSSWFTHDRFGLLIHWGIYALPARHEWIMNRELLSDEEYQKYVDYFDPSLSPIDLGAGGEECGHVDVKLVDCATPAILYPVIRCPAIRCHMIR